MQLICCNMPAAKYCGLFDLITCQLYSSVKGIRINHNVEGTGSDSPYNPHYATKRREEGENTEKQQEKHTKQERRHKKQQKQGKKDDSQRSTMKSKENQHKHGKARESTKSRTSTEKQETQEKQRSSEKEGRARQAQKKKQ